MTKSLCEHLVDEYITWLRERISITKIDDKWCEITTPFLDRHNDHLQIYVKALDNERLLLSDDGYTIADLKMSGCDIERPRRRMFLDMVLNGFGVRVENDRLEVEARLKESAQKKHNLLQAMLAVNDLFITARPHVFELFREDVEHFLSLHKVRFVPSVKFAGRSGFDHNFDFIVPPSNGHPERAIRAINRPSREKATSLIFAATDTRGVRPEGSRVIGVLNDTEGAVPEEVLGALTQYEVGFIKWSEREQHIGEVAG